MPKSHNTFIILRMQELTPSMALELLKSGMRILTIALITVVKTVNWSSGPHQLRHRFGQHMQVLLAGFELLLRSFLLLDIGAGAKPLDDLALGIFERLCSDQEPAIATGRAMAQAQFRFIWPAGLDGALPPRLDAWPVIGMDTLQPSISLRLFGSHAGIVAPALICIVNKPVWSPGPDELGDGIKQYLQFVFGVLAFGDIPACADEILDLLAASRWEVIVIKMSRYISVRG